MGVLSGSPTTAGNFAVTVTASDSAEGQVSDTFEIMVAPANTSSFVVGTSGPDTLVGTAGNDGLYGFEGDDTLDGGLEKDWYSGGEGRDTFVLELVGGQDTISDFEDGLDKIGLKGGLNFSELGIVQEGTHTHIQSNGKTLGILSNIDSGLTNSEDFIMISIDPPPGHNGAF